MKGTIKTTTIKGNTFSYYADYILRGTFATNELTGETKQISWSGYLNKDLTVRKAIAEAFNLDTFRK